MQNQNFRIRELTEWVGEKKDFYVRHYEMAIWFGVRIRARVFFYYRGKRFYTVIFVIGLVDVMNAEIEIFQNKYSRLNIYC